MSLAKRMQKTASRLLDKFDESSGRIVLVSIKSEWDDSLGEMVETESRSNLVGVTTGYNLPDIDGEAIQSGDIRCVVKFDTAPQSSDKVEFDGNQWSIVSVKENNYTGVVINYEMQLRR